MKGLLTYARLEALFLKEEEYHIISVISGLAK